MNKKIAEKITTKVTELQDKTGCWNVLKEGDKYYPQFNYYAPNYKSTLWTLVFLADIKTDINKNDFSRPLKIISEHFLDKKNKIYSIGKSHFPIPCLNGNMLYLHSYFNFGNRKSIENIIDFFAEYQRFDDGDFKTTSSFPYCSNRSCYGKHTCYWGVVKLLKGLFFIPSDKRSKNAKKLLNKCIDFVLLHKVCYSSHNYEKFIHPKIQYLTFPNMYNSDFLEILWLLKREKVKSDLINEALNLLKSKMQSDNVWKIERKINNLIVPFGKQNYGNCFITDRARYVFK